MLLLDSWHNFVFAIKIMVDMLPLRMFFGFAHSNLYFLIYLFLCFHYFYIYNCYHIGEINDYISNYSCCIGAGALEQTGIIKCKICNATTRAAML